MLDKFEFISALRCNFLGWKKKWFWLLKLQPCSSCLSVVWDNSWNVSKFLYTLRTMHKVAHAPCYSHTDQADRGEDKRVLTFNGLGWGCMSTGSGAPGRDTGRGPTLSERQRERQGEISTCSFFMWCLRVAVTTHVTTPPLVHVWKSVLTGLGLNTTIVVSYASCRRFSYLPL